MKLRIKGNSIRLRLQKAEIASLREGKAIEEEVRFSSTSRLVYALERGGSELSASFDAGRVAVRLPEALARDLCDTDRVGVEGASGDVRILIEKDWQCLTARDEDESDAFPHPRANAK